MNLKKIILIFLVVSLLVIVFSFLFIKLFSFEKEEDIKSIPEVSETLVDKLYSYLPGLNNTDTSSIYTTYYTTYQNLNSEIVKSMIYEYILKNKPEQLESVTIAELINSGIKDNNIEPLYKINSQVFIDTLPNLFGEKELKLSDFHISSKTFAKLNGDIFYIYNKLDNIESDYVIFKAKTRYSLTDNNATLIIYDYYLKCDKNSKKCYNDEDLKFLNNKIRYNESLDINNYLDSLKEYEHIFKYEKGNYYWISSQGI